MNASAAHADAMIYIARMNITSAHRSEISERRRPAARRRLGFARHSFGERSAALPAVSLRGPHSLQSNCGDRARRHLHHSRHRRPRPALVRFTRGRGAIFHLLIARCDRDAAVQILSRRLSARTHSRGTGDRGARQSGSRSAPPRPNRNDQSAIRAARRGFGGFHRDGPHRADL